MTSSEPLASERGDFILMAGRPASETTSRLPDGYEVIAVEDGVVIGVKRGWNLEVAELSGLVVIVCGSVLPHRTALAKQIAERLSRSTNESVREAVTATLRPAVGHFACAVVTESTALTATDHMATTPIYVGSGRLERVSGTNLSDLAGLAPVELDGTSTEEFIARGVITSPHTIFRSVLRQWPATVRSADEAIDDVQPYWSPPLPDAESDEAAERYRLAAMETMATLSQNHSAVTVLFSGGEDSRIVAWAAREAGLDARAAIFLDEKNREYRHAKLAAALLGTPLSIRYRGADHHDGGLARDVVRVGPGIDVVSRHSRGLVDLARDPLPVLDGWFAELSKAGGLATRQRKWRGLPTGTAQPHDQAVLAATPKVGSPDTNDDLRQRLSRKLDRISHLPELSAFEWMGQFPASDQSTFQFFAYNQRSFPGFSPFLLQPLVGIAGSVPVDQRLNRRFLKDAFGHSMGIAGLVPRDDGEVLGLPTHADLVATFMNRVSYRVAGRFRSAHQGPWQALPVRLAASHRALQRCDEECVRVVLQQSPLARATMDRTADDSRAMLRIHRIAQLAITVEHFA